MEDHEARILGLSGKVAVVYYSIVMILKTFTNLPPRGTAPVKEVYAALHRASSLAREYFLGDVSYAVLQDIILGWIAADILLVDLAVNPEAARYAAMEHLLDRLAAQLIVLRDIGHDFDGDDPDVE